MAAVTEDMQRDAINQLKQAIRTREGNHAILSPRAIKVSLLLNVRLVTRQHVHPALEWRRKHARARFLVEMPTSCLRRAQSSVTSALLKFSRNSTADTPVRGRRTPSLPQGRIQGRISIFMAPSVFSWNVLNASST